MDEFDDLQRRFAEVLPEKVKALRAQCRKLGASEGAGDEGLILRHELHSLTGCAGTFGLPALADASRQLGVLLRPLLDRGVPLDAETLQAVEEQVTRIEQLAQSEPMTPVPFRSQRREPPHSESVPLVHVVEDDALQAEYLASVLSEDGYRVRAFADLKAFRSAYAGGETPDALVLDVVFPEGDRAGIDLLSELNAGGRRSPPTVVVSVLDDIDARLAAYRAGASRYLHKPMAPGMLLDVVDGLLERAPREAYRVLLVDDDPLLLEAQAAMLRTAGMGVRAISQPRKTLEALDAFDPDVVVLDVYMPDISGPELTAIVRERDDCLSRPILFLSPEVDIRPQLRPLSLVGVDVLVKPVDPEQLVAAVTARASRARRHASVHRRLQTNLYERQREQFAVNEHAIVSITDGVGTITYVNDRFCEVSGYDRDELIGSNHRILKSGQHPPAFYDQLWASISAGETWHGEICNRRKDGSLYWVASTITPFLDDRGLPYQYISVRTDITEVRAAEAAQREQAAMLGMLTEAAGDLLAAGVDTLDATLERILRQASEYLGMDRAYVCQISEGGMRAETSHQWCAAGAPSPASFLGGASEERLPWLWARIQRNEPVIVADVAALPSEAEAEHTRFADEGIRTLCVFPINRAGTVLGLLGFDRVRGAARTCAPAVLDLIGLLADLIGSALVRTAGEQALQQQYTFTQGVLDSVSAHIAVLDRDGVIVAVNEPWRRFARQNAPDPAAVGPATDIGVNYLDVCGRAEDGPVGPSGHSAADAMRTAAGIEAVMTGRAPSFRQEYPCHSPTEARWFEMTVMPLAHDGGGVVVSHANVTDRRQAEADAEAAKERLRRGQLFANIGTWEWNVATGELFWSERVAPLFGYAEGELETSYDNFIKAIHPDDREAVYRAIDAAIQHDKPYDIEHRVVWPDGSVRWLLERGAVQRDDEGRTVSMIGVVQDIDDRKRAERALAERERQLLEAQALASLGHWTTDLATGEVFWSDEVYRIFGHEPGRFRPSIEGFFAAVHPDDRTHVQESNRQAETTHKVDVVHRIVRPDGQVRHVHELAQLQLDTTGKPRRLTGTVQDVTERIEFQQALIAAREEAERANQAKSEFLSSMSHELRTPMNAILGFGQLMEYDTSLPEAHRDNVREILGAGQHLLELINEVLDLARIESGRIDLSLEAVEVCSVVEECLSLVSTQAERRSIQLVHQGVGGVAVWADRTRFKQALLNLLSNAIKYNREGGRVRLEVQRVQASGAVRIRVEDTGRGIAPERLPELFEPFNRLDAEASGIEGTGIGLNLTRRIIELMGGTVEAESEVGVGSTFWIELPPRESRDGSGEREASGPAPMAANTPEPGRKAPFTVLYIEDNPANIRLVEQILDPLPEVGLVTAHTPELGLDLALSHRPAVILLDINLPGMDGYRLLEAIQTEAGLKDIPVIAITANAMPRDIERGRAAGFFEYLTKPLDVEQFLDAVKRGLARDAR